MYSREYFELFLMWAEIKALNDLCQTHKARVGQSHVEINHLQTRVEELLRSYSYNNVTGAISVDTPAAIDVINAETAYISTRFSALQTELLEFVITPFLYCKGLKLIESGIDRLLKIIKSAEFKLKHFDNIETYPGLYYVDTAWIREKLEEWMLYKKTLPRFKTFIADLQARAKDFKGLMYFLFFLSSFNSKEDQQRIEMAVNAAIVKYFADLTIQYSKLDFLLTHAIKQFFARTNVDEIRKRVEGGSVATTTAVAMSKGEQVTTRDRLQPRYGKFKTAMLFAIRVGPPVVLIKKLQQAPVMSRLVYDDTAKRWKLQNAGAGVKRPRATSNI